MANVRLTLRAGRPAAVTVLALLAVISMLLFSGLSCKDRSQRQEVVLYCSVDQQIAEPVVAAFERQTGIKVLARYDTEASKTVGLVQRIRAEAGAPAADVFWSGEIFHTIRLAREGLLAPYRGGSPENWPAGLADPNGLWHGLALRARAIGYNTSKVSAQEAPKSLEDVLDAKWKGRLVMASPAFGTTGGDVASWFAHYGSQRAKEILQQLKENDVRIVSGNSTAVRMVATGQADLCFTDTDDVYAGQRNGWPVAMHFLDQDGEGVLAIPNTAAMIKGGPHPAAAKRLMQFLLSEETERLLAESDSHNSPIHESVARRYPQYTISRALNIDYGRIADFLPEAIQSAEEILE